MAEVLSNGQVEKQWRPGPPPDAQKDLENWMAYVAIRNEELKRMMDACCHLSVRNSSKGSRKKPDGVTAS